jgi:hypothetical protein
VSASVVTRAIGFRVEPSKVHWAVADGPKDAPRIEARDVLASPATFKGADRLAWYAREVTDLCNRFSPKPQAAWVRLPETVGMQKRKPMQERAWIEGVIIAAVIGLGIEVRSGALASITSKVKRAGATGRGTSAKTYLSSDDFRGISLTNFDANMKEAILVAVAALS